MARVYRPAEDSLLLLAHARERVHGSVLDMGTGSGFLAVEIASEPLVDEVVAVDIDPEAVKESLKRAEEAGVADKIKFVVSDLFRGLEGRRFNWILFNPPYLPSEGAADEAFWAGFWPAVRAGMHDADARAGSFWSGLLRPSLAWAAAAALLVVALLAVTRPWAPEPGETGPAVAVSAERAPLMDGWPAVLPASSTPGEPVLPTVEEVRSPTARVLSMKVYGEDQAVTEVVLIVDEEIEL